MITYQNERKPKVRRCERRPVMVRLAPADYNLLSVGCAESGRSYGEFVSLLLNEWQLRLQAKEERRLGA